MGINEPRLWARPSIGEGHGTPSDVTGLPPSVPGEAYWPGEAKPRRGFTSLLSVWPYAAGRSTAVLLLANRKMSNERDAYLAAIPSIPVLHRTAKDLEMPKCKGHPKVAQVSSAFKRADVCAY